MRSIVSAEVIISEIMYNPQGTDFDNNVTPNIYREWVELYNTGATAVNIGGWQFGDSQDNTYAAAFPAGTTIGPSQALIVTGDAAHFDLEWGPGINRIQVSSFPSLANDPSPTNETAALRDNLGAFRDQVNFDDSNGWPRVTGSDGHSISVVPQGLSSTANDIGTNWKPTMRGVYGAVFKSADGENHGSPGVVGTTPQIPFVPSPDAAWSMVYMPDTQNYVKSATDFHIMTEQTTWIRDHRDDFKIKAVIQGGDIVNKNDTANPSGELPSTQQWQNAQAGMFVLNGYVPYIMAAGNHDFGFTNADNRDTMINNYFRPTDNPLNDPAQGGILKGTMVPNDITNAYYAFTAPDGRQMLIFSLEWEPRQGNRPGDPDNLDVVGWANGIAARPEYAGHTAVLLTHNYLQGDNTRSTTTNVPGDASGQMLWDNLVKTHENFEMTFNGHFGGDGAGVLRSTGTNGNAVEQIFLDTQFETYGGGGWMRVVEFLQDGRTVRVRTYSPFYNLYRTGADYEFEFQLSQIPLLPGDYNGNHVVDANDYLVWRKTVGSQTDLRADGNGDGVINQLDYTYWRQRFGNLPGSGSSFGVNIPEAGTLMLLCVAAGVYPAMFPRRKRM